MNQRILCLGLAVMFGLAAPRSGAQSVVLNTNDAGVGSLRDAISNAAPGTIITFDPSLSGATITLTSGQLLLNQNLTIDASALANGIAINGNQTSRILDVTNATVLLSLLTITNGFALNGGGGILVGAGAILTMSNCTVSGNHAGAGTFPAGGGGGIVNVGTLTMYRCLVSGNFSDGVGGGIAAGGYNYFTALTMNECTVASNSASHSWGGGLHVGYCNFTLNQSTICGNTADLGGGIFNDSGITVLNQDTICSNFAIGPDNPIGQRGAGVYNEEIVYFTNCIVTGNTEPGYASDLLNAGTMSLGGCDVIQSIIGLSPTVTGTVITNTARLAPLGWYGGPTPTMPPLPGSPGIDGCTAGTSFTTDQRGFPRVAGRYADVGAVEGIYNSAGPGYLTGLGISSSGFQLAFTNYSDTSWAVFATTNLALPLSQYSNLGPAVETPVGSGQFRFTDTQATNTAQRFYVVRPPVP